MVCSAKGIGPSPIHTCCGAAAPPPSSRHGVRLSRLDAARIPASMAHMPRQAKAPGSPSPRGGTRHGRTHPLGSRDEWPGRSALSPSRLAAASAETCDAVACADLAGARRSPGLRHPRGLRPREDPVARALLGNRPAPRALSPPVGISRCGGGSDSGDGAPHVERLEGPARASARQNMRRRRDRGALPVLPCRRREAAASATTGAHKARSGGRKRKQAKFTTQRACAAADGASAANMRTRTCDDSTHYAPRPSLHRCVAVSLHRSFS